MASRKIEYLDPLLLPIYNRFKELLNGAGVDFIVTCTWRSPEEQNQLYAQGRTVENGVWTVTNKKKVVTWVRAGDSAHNYTRGGEPSARAFDIAILGAGKLNWDPKHKDWVTARRIGSECGLKNLFPAESAHFELPDWRKK